MEQLGFKFTDTKILIGNHAHGDHQEGDALVKQVTGAQVVVMAEDVPALRAIKPGGKEHPVDRTIRDGETVRLGDTVLTAHLTPGHTRGCTTWTMKVKENSKTRNVVIIGSPNVNPGYKLVDNTAYPQIAADYEKTFRVLKSLPIDYFLGAHGSYFDMETKYKRFKAGDANAFIDPEGYMKYVNEREQAFRQELKKQSKPPNKTTAQTSTSAVFCLQKANPGRAPLTKGRAQTLLRSST